MAILLGEFHCGLIFLSMLALTSSSPVNKTFNLKEVPPEGFSALDDFSGIASDHGEDSVCSTRNSHCIFPFERSVSCEEDLEGIGSLDSTCQLNASLHFDSDMFISGKGSLEILSHVSIICPFAGCVISINISGDLKLSQYASLLAGTLVVDARNLSLEENSSLSTTALGGAPPAQTSGTPLGFDGAGGGHGGRGACCVKDKSKDPEDTWGGDVYAWSTLFAPWSFGSRGGTKSGESGIGGGGGGRIMIVAGSNLDVNGTVTAEGGDGGHEGGGGSGGSIILRASKLKGTGTISASGGRGWAGGGGGRIAIDCYSRQESVKIIVHGGNSIGCPANAGAAGTRFDTVLQSLIISNDNMSTLTDTPLLDFPAYPLWSNVYVESHAKVVVPLLWSRVQVRGQISLLYEGTLSFGLAEYPFSEFELMAEELLMSDSTIKVYGALRMSVKMLLMWNSKLQIDGRGDVMVHTSLLEASNLMVLRERSVISSNSNLGVHGQGLLKLSGTGDTIKGQRLFLSLFYNIHRVGVNNPVMLLDEVDKTGSDVRGDPAAALLEVLDPEQNRTFNDHYLNVPFDLSKVVFVATANRVQPIPPPLLDRMEVIELPGYTPEEKLRIAMSHLIPRVLEQHGLTSQYLQISETVVEIIIQRYTQEAGVRNLERHLAALARAAAVKVTEREQSIQLTKDIQPESSALLEGSSLADGEAIEMEIVPMGVNGHDISNALESSQILVVDEAMLENVLGPPKFDDREAAERVAAPGVAVGLVWTTFGGEVQFVEATAMVGKGDLHLTGQLGDVIKESAQIALTWVRARAAELRLATASEINLMESRDIHIHFPAGAVPKDGPSAGVTLVTALVSLFGKKKVRADTAMTGEMTLRGLILPVGGIKDKILAAHRCRIKRVILPERNVKDLAEVPAAVLVNMEILLARRMEDVLDEAFEGGCPWKQHARL